MGNLIKELVIFAIVAVCFIIFGLAKLAAMPIDGVPLIVVIFVLWGGLEVAIHANDR